MTVSGLLDADHCDEDQGILCKAKEGDEPVELALAELESTVHIHNRQLIEDYAYWFYNWIGESSAGESRSEWITLEASPYQPKKWSLFGTMVRLGVVGGVIGISLGSILGAMEIVQIGAIVGAVLVGLPGYWVGKRYGMVIGEVNRLRHGSLYGGILGAIGGGTLGALIGALLGAIVGIVIGMLIGAVISKWFLQGFKRLLGVALGAAAGATLQAFYFDHEKAAVGAIIDATLRSPGCGLR